MATKKLYVVWYQAQHEDEDGAMELDAHAVACDPAYGTREAAEVKAKSLKAAGLFACVETREVEIL